MSKFKALSYDQSNVGRTIGMTKNRRCWRFQVDGQEQILCLDLSDLSRIRRVYLNNEKLLEDKKEKKKLNMKLKFNQIVVKLKQGHSGYILLIDGIDFAHLLSREKNVDQFQFENRTPILQSKSFVDQQKFQNPFDFQTNRICIGKQEKEQSGTSNPLNICTKTEDVPKREKPQNPFHEQIFSDEYKGAILRPPPDSLVQKKKYEQAKAFLSKPIRKSQTCNQYGTTFQQKPQQNLFQNPSIPSQQRRNFQLLPQQVRRNQQKLISTQRVSMIETQKMPISQNPQILQPQFFNPMLNTNPIYSNNFRYMPQYSSSYINNQVQPQVCPNIQNQIRPSYPYTNSFQNSAYSNFYYPK